MRGGPPTRRTEPPEPSHAHEHQWRVPEHTSAFRYEDGAVHVEDECHYTEGKTAGHSERLDETFYETTYVCEERRVHRFDLMRIERYGPRNAEVAKTLAAGRDGLSELYDECPRLVEEVEQRAAERLTGRSDADDGPRACEWVRRGSVMSGEHSIDVSVSHGETTAQSTSASDVDDVRVGKNTYKLTYEHTETHRT